MSGNFEGDNCSHFSTSELKSLNLGYCVSGAVCCLISSVIALLLIISKSYYSVLQRLLLYLMIATALSELFITASIERYPEFENSIENSSDKACTGMAYMYNWMNLLRIVFTVGAMVYLFFLVWYVAKGNIVPQFLQSQHRKVFLEILYVILSPLVTFVYALVPLITQNYGLSGAWCWIRELNENCDCELVLSGLLNQLLHGYILLLFNSIIGIVLIISVAVVHCQLSAALKESRKLLTKTLIVMAFYFLYSSVQVYAFINGMILAVKGTYPEHFAVWYTFAISYPISLLLFPAAFFFSFYPAIKLGLKYFCCQCAKNTNPPQKRHVHFQQQQANTSHNVPTFRDSSRVSAPSHTYFDVPYTNEFTHITTENEPLLSNDGKGAASIKATGADAEYGSVSHQQESKIS